ncbi:MAG: hypothetical protein QXH80_01160 [Candidatus Nanoarchaeia archaeon]
MGIVNRIINGLIAVLAIVSVIFGYMLFEKREQLVKRGDIMAQVINNVASKLDSGSGTSYAEKLQLLKLELDPQKDPNAQKNAEKTLYHTNYKHLQSVLEPFKKQALDIIEQRDTLGSALNDVAVKLEIPETYTPAQFNEIKSYKEKKTSLLDNVAKVNERDNAIMAQISASAGVIGYSLDKETLKSLDNYKTPLDEFSEKVQALKKRSDSYADHIKRVCAIFQIQEPSLSGDDYSNELSSARDALKGVKDEFEKTKTELAETKTKLEETQEDLNKALAKIEAHEKKIAELNKQVAILRGDIEDDSQKPQEGAQKDEKANLVEKLEGKVIELNPKWGFVVIDLGKNNKVLVGGKKKREEIVPLPEGKIMLVGRDDKYIGKIKIVRVNDYCAIANVLPEEKEGKVEVGDRVYFGKKTPAVTAAQDAGAAATNVVPAPAPAPAPLAPADEKDAAPATEDELPEL